MDKHSFCRIYLKTVMEEVGKCVPKTIIKKSWAIGSFGDCAEFHINRCKDIPEGFYWYGKSCCLWYAKAQGWSEYLEKKGGRE